MRAQSLSKTSYPIISKQNGSHKLDPPFRDDNLRDPLINEKGFLGEDISINTTFRHGSDVFDSGPKHMNLDKGIPDLRNSQTLFATKSQASLVSIKKTKKLKPMGRSNEVANFNSTTGLKSSNLGVSDFYLKNFLGKQRIETEGRKDENATNLNFFDLPKTIRSATIENRKEKISARQIQNELAQISSGYGLKQKFYDTLGASYKEFYMDKKEFMKIFDDIDVAMFCHEEVVERLKCYRFELGTLLNKVGVSYKKILERMLELTMKISSEKDLIHEKKMEENFQGIKILENEKKSLEEKNKQYKNLSDVTESEANIYKFNVKSLQNEVSMLYELLKKDYLVQDRSDHLHEELRDEKIHDPLKAKDAEPSKLLAKNLLTLQESIKNLESEQNTKEERLQEMNNLLKAMLRGGKKEASTQVDEGELAWAAKNILTQDDYKPKAADFEVHESSSVNMDPHLGVQATKEEITEGVDPVQVLKFKEKMDKKESEESSQPEQSKAHTGRSGAGNKESQIVGDNWNLPLSIIVFLENTTKANKTANVLPWPFFKRILYEVYQDKITNSFEIQNALINTCVSMNEYLVIYFLKAYRLRRTAEMKLLEFLVSLKYYLKTWQRAATFANLCNISSIKIDSTVGTFPEFDIYAQNFFLFAFTKVSSQVSNIYDNSDGVSYLIKDRVDEISNDILSFENEANRKKFTEKLYRYYSKFSDNGKEFEGIDVDKLLHLYLEAYFEAKGRNTQTLTKYFYKQNSGGEGVFSIDEILQITSDIIDIESPIQGYSYPKELSVCRAFLYALTSGKNTFAVTFKDFIQGMSRFGIDCPFPFINASMQGVAIPVSASSFALGDDKSPTKKTITTARKSKVQSMSPGTKSVTPRITAETPKKIAEEDTSSQGSVKIPGLATIENKEGKKKKEEDKNANFKIDSTSSLFAQHFSIIRELKAYCNQFKDMLSKESDAQKVWKGFDQIIIALEAGCQFLSYPVTL